MILDIGMSDDRPRQSGAQASAGPSDPTLGLERSGAYPARRVYLVVFEGDSSRMFAFPDRGEVVVGRAEDADLRLDDAGVSRRHAKISIRDVGTEIIDLGSQNGTFVNGARVDARPLMSGDFIEIGGVGLVFHGETGAAPTSPSGSPGGGDAPRELSIAGQRVIIADLAMMRLHGLIDRLAASDLPVLICGETGSGKEIAAAALHQASPRRRGPFVALNCAAVQESLLESELFGHERGAFTGAGAAKPGLLETASGGTVFLDEIGDLPAASQAKLLRALDTKRITRVGDVHERAVDIRIVAATNRDLAQDVQRGGFRQDLYYRLSGATLWLPPLRDRPRELALLARTFVADACARLGRPTMAISDAAMRRLAQHDWPGNVRELKNVMQYVVAAFDAAVIEPEHLDQRLEVRAAAPAPTDPHPARALEASAAAAPAFRPIGDEVRELERSRMEAALAAAGGNQTRAAELIGMPLRTFVTKAAQYGLRSKKGS